MELKIFETGDEIAEAAADKAAKIIKKAVKTRGKAVFIAATGASQLKFLDILTKDKSIDWLKVIMFHLDEYLGLSAEHPASFRRYLRERVIGKVNPGKVYLINGDAKNPEEECERLNRIISKERVDVAFLGIGENGHLAFNEPPADFETKKPFIIVKLDKATKKQQLNEGWFSKLSDVPKKAITMSISQIMKSKNIILIAPGKRKAKAVKNCFRGKISPYCPASILQKHKTAFVYLDRNSASLF